ncbi:MAG: siroheme decarboxylase subunit beta [Bacillota bacterium]
MEKFRIREGKLIDYTEQAKKKAEESNSSAWTSGGATAPGRLEPVDQRLLTELQRGVALAGRPFEGLAAAAGCPPGEVLERLAALKRSGLIRRFGGIFDTRALGFSSTLVAAAVPPERLEQVAAAVSEFPGVTHNYAREGVAYNLWFTVGSSSPRGLDETLAEIAHRTGVAKWLRLPAEKVYKIGVKLDLTGEGAERALVPAAAGSGPEPTATPADPATPDPAPSDPATPDPADRRLIAVMQGDVPLVERPFAEAGRQAGLTEDDVLHRLARFHEAGWLRRVAATLYHHRAGFTANAMSIWRLPADRVDEAGAAMAAFAEVSHCYRRPTSPDWPYSLYAMIHGRAPEDCRRVAEAIAQVVQPEAYDLLFSTREFKKTSMTYF